MARRLRHWAAFGACLVAVVGGANPRAWAIPSLMPHPHKNPTAGGAPGPGAIPGVTDGDTTWINGDDPVPDPDPNMPDAKGHQHRDRHPLNNTNVTVVPAPAPGGVALGFKADKVWDDRNLRTGANGQPLAEFAHGFVNLSQPLRYRFVEGVSPGVVYTAANPPKPEGRWNTDANAIQMRTIVESAFETWERQVTGMELNVNGVPTIRSLAFERTAGNDAEIYVHLGNAGINPGSFFPGLRHIGYRDQVWDYDPTNGIAANRTDFTSVALHEIGHALGFDHFGTDRRMNLMAGTGIANGMLGAGIDAGSLDGARDLYSIPIFESLRDFARPFIGSRANPSVSFDSQTQLLTFAPGQINFADMAGGFTQSLDPQFAGDPLLGAYIRVTPLEHAGVTAAGLHTFNGGTLTIDNGTATEVGDTTYFSGDFDLYFLDDTLDDGSPSVNDFTVFLNPVINNTIGSSLLAQLADTAYGPDNLFLDFFFKSSGPDAAVDLVSLTKDFTENGSVDVTYYLGPNGFGKDFGDAPDSYQTLLASDGPRYREGDLQRLGRGWDSERDGQPTPNADGDDRSLLGGLPAAIDDEDGVRFGESSVDVTFNITRNGPQDYLFDAWWDTNRNGVFNHPSEHYIDSLLTLDAGIHTFHFDLPFDPRDFYSRFRLTWVDDPTGTLGGVTRVTDITPFGEFFDAQGVSHGEVEDYPPVPEPASVVLMALGGLGLLVSRWRHKRGRG